MNYNGLNHNGKFTNLFQYPINNVNRMEITPNFNNILPTNNQNYIGGLPFSREIVPSFSTKNRNPLKTGIVGNSPEQMAYYSEDYHNANFYSYPQIPFHRPNIQYIAQTAPYYANMIDGERLGFIRPN
tara:strand:+ start:923 stop:1306 length:384 start_codon:yes stop_codon:yes gene_type:complete